MKQNTFNEFKTLKTFKVITKNGPLLFFNPRIRNNDGLIEIENFRFEVSDVKNLTIENRSNTVTLDFTGDKVDELCEGSGSVSEFVNSLSW